VVAEHHLLQGELADIVFEPRVPVGESARVRPAQLEHRPLDRHGQSWEQMRAAVASPDGWDLGMGRFAARVTVAG
jgi:hypothetical protein